MEGKRNIMFRRTMAIVAGAALVLAGALAVQPAAADVIGPQGGPTAECQAAGFDYGVKLDTGTPGDYSYPSVGSWSGPGAPYTAPTSLKVTINGDNTFDWWDAVPAVAGVLVKAGTGYTILPGGTSGEGTPSNGKGISHITFCYNDDQNEPEEHLTVTKTVNTSWDRRHNWKLDKSVDVHDVYLYAPGGMGSGTATVNWTVKVDYVAPPTDGNYKVWGSITVLNDGETAVAVNEVTDTLTVGMVDTSLTVDCGQDLAAMPKALAVGESMVCTYEHWPSEKIDGYNTATASTLTGNTYESLPVDVVFGAEPTNETDETVTVTDVSDIDGEQSKTFHAPTGGSLEYSHTFEWADFEECGDYSYDNTATLTSKDSDLWQQDSETVNVHVQCVVFQGETAWAANMGPLTDRYTKKGNWATYVTYTGGTKTYSVYAGQTMYAGTATIAPAGAGYVTITVDLAAGWDYAENGAYLKVQGYTSKPSGNPEPGLFASHTLCTGDPCTTAPIAYNGGTMYYGIHVDVGKWVPDPNFP